MRLVRCLAVGIAALGLLLLLLVALNLARFGPHRLERWRETTWVVHGAVLLFVFFRRRPGAFVLELRRRTATVVGHPRFFAWMCGVFLAVYLAAAVTQHLAFRTFSHDLWMIDTALAGTEGRGPLHSTVLERSFLSEHFSPILFFLVPLHAIVPCPWLLVLVQPLALWAAVFVLRRILDRDGLSPALRNLGCLVYLDHPIVISTLQYLFHMECFLPLCVFLAWDALRSRRWIRAAAAVVAALAVKEDVGLYMAGLGLYWMIAERLWMRGALLAVFSIAWFVLVLAVFFPSFDGDTGARFLSRWGRWGEDPVAIGLGFLRDPIAVLRALLHEPLPRYFACLALLPFYKPLAILLFVAPWLLNTTSGNVQQASLSLYYGIPLLVFACLAAVEGLRTPAFARLRAWRWSHLIAAFVVMLNVAHFRFPEIPRDRRALLAALDRIPAAASIQAMACFFPVLGHARRPELLHPGSRPTADYVLLRRRGSTWPLEPGDVERLRREGIESGYAPLYESAGFAVLERAR